MCESTKFMRHVNANFRNLDCGLRQAYISKPAVNTTDQPDGLDGVTCAQAMDPNELRVRRLSPPGAAARLTLRPVGGVRSERSRPGPGTPRRPPPAPATPTAAGRRGAT